VGSWQNISSISVPAGATVNLGPQPLNVGSWNWTGPNGFSSTAREIDNIQLSTGTNTYTATYTNTSGCKSTQAFVVTVSAGVNTNPVQVNLSSAFNVNGIFPNYSLPSNGGLDGGGYAYSSSLIGNSLTWSGSPFSIGGASSPDAVYGATITLPAGIYPSVKILAAGVNGLQTNQRFEVTYTDGTTSTFTQSISDWFNESSVSGETVALTMSYRVTYNGRPQNGPYHLYGYSFALNTSKTVKSITLPSNRNVVVLAITL
jgi:hypothetical protein